MEKLSIEQEYQQMRQMLNEKQWRQYLAAEAQRRESVSQVAREAGVSINTVKRGLKELEAGEGYRPGERIRRSGGGMKKLVETDATLLSDLEQELQPKGDPIISVDCKKKELIGTFKNNGREWQAKGEDTCVNVYDFLSLADGKAVPYGIYDLIHKSGFVNVGIDHDTAEFAVESIRRWWHRCGKALYPANKELLITADGGGSNGARNRLWKKKLQDLANEEHLAITVVHYPPATSKWNKIEHRLFSFISINWRAKPLTSLEVVLELISHTTTKEGLTVTAVKDSRTYPTGLKISDDELAALNLSKDAFHGEWNYTIKPQIA